MAFMMTLGILLRRTNILPDFFFAFFYTGLGSALVVAGLMFILRFGGLKVRQVIWISVGIVSVSLGTVGIFLPLIPTVPLYLLASFSFLRSSERLLMRFKKGKL